MAKKKKEEKLLSSAELLQMEMASQKALNRELQLKYFRLELSKANKELTLISANYTLKTKEIEEIQNKISKHEKDHRNILLEHKEFVSGVKDKLLIKKDNWGYDPITGEIKE